MRSSSSSEGFWLGTVVVVVFTMVTWALVAHALGLFR